MILLLPRFCAYFSLHTLKTMINIWPHLKFFRPCGYVELATALVGVTEFLVF